jgi:predicted transcriptional regulator
MRTRQTTIFTQPFSTGTAHASAINTGEAVIKTFSACRECAETLRPSSRGSFIAERLAFEAKSLDCLFDTAKLMNMEVHLSPEKEALLHQLAARTGKDTTALVREAVDRLLDYDQWFIQEVEKGLEQAARGELIDHEEVVKRIESHLQQKRRS